MRKFQLLFITCLLLVFANCKKENINNDSGNVPVLDTNPLCFTAEEAGATIKMQVSGEYWLLETLPIIEYSFDKTNWQELIIGASSITLENIGDKVYLRGDNPQGINPDFDANFFVYVQFQTNDKRISASGNVMSLVDPTCQSKTVPAGCFAYLFAETSITTAPDLPATELGDRCYMCMFGACPNLTEAPELPATTMADDCYRSMFGGCVSLTSCPKLPATTLAQGCYGYMFSNCDNLTSCPDLPAMTLATACYAYMFNDCDNLVTAPELPATTLANGCYSRMFYDCDNLATAPELPATELALWCYEYMFSYCPKLTSAPELPATVLKDSCYNMMFYGCINLNNIKVHFTNWGDGHMTYSWLENTAEVGTFYCPSELEHDFHSPSRIPEGWTVETF